MPANDLKCGHCGHDNFDTPRDLIAHVRKCSPPADDVDSDPADADRDPPLITDGGALTRTCGECGLATRRQRLIPTEEGYLVCPACGNVLEAHTGIDLTDPTAYVLKLATNGGSAYKFHVPSFTNPTTPRCQITNRRSVTYSPTTRDVLRDRYSLCDNCAALLPSNQPQPDPPETDAAQDTREGDLSTTVWYSTTGEVYHEDLSGIPACPEVMPNVDEHTLREARDTGKRPCKDCCPVQYPEEAETESHATKLGDFA